MYGVLIDLCVVVVKVGDGVGDLFGVVFFLVGGVYCDIVVEGKVCWF